MTLPLPGVNIEFSQGMPMLIGYVPSQPKAVVTLNACR
jgi:hypothetical protein